MPTTKIFFNARLKALFLIACAACGVIALRLVDIQVVRHGYYLEMAERNRTQVLYQTAPRGRVFTSDGVAVASNQPSFSFYYLAAGRKDTPYLQHLAQDFAPKLGLSEDALTDKLLEGLKSGKAVALAENLSPKTTIALQELQIYYPGVYLLEETKRDYPYGSFASHLIGYLGSMEDSEWRKRDLRMNYRLNSKIGKNGIEKKYERELKGTDGGAYLEVDYRGRVKRVIEDRKWEPGSDVYLTLNFAVQRAAEEGLKKTSTGRGAAVALDTRTGAVLALASAPAYDPNIFVPYSDDSSPKNNKQISEYNLAIQGTYPPASTFKILTAIAALQDPDFNPNDKIKCPGYYNAGSRVFKCWKKTGHGPMNLEDGLANSCDVYFYATAAQIGSAAIERVQRAFMFGRPTGIDLPGERSGNMYGPTKRARNKSYWFIGDTLNLSIGQGELLVTPIKLAQFAAAVASRGKVFRPYYVEKLVSNHTGKETPVGKTEILNMADYPADTYNLIWHSMKHTTDAGTARWAKIPGLDVYAKTGTAQNPHGDDHAWFMAFAGRAGEEPSIALAVFVEYGLHGSSAAGPVAREMLKAYFGVDDRGKVVASDVPAANDKEYSELLENLGD
ncbi:penicillin-binding protein 2 [Candidatus Avelusimicrobium faecicola]|uniref:penicillin-binding protein 2 n=1 Tax=Candidatus Avelusimicrobium faecicola TaxID=3416205 RepID=UPI003D11504A